MWFLLMLQQAQEDLYKMIENDEIMFSIFTFYTCFADSSRTHGILSAKAWDSLCGLA